MSPLCCPTTMRRANVQSHPVPEAHVFGGENGSKMRGCTWGRIPVVRCQQSPLARALRLLGSAEPDASRQGIEGVIEQVVHTLVSAASRRHRCAATLVVLASPRWSLFSSLPDQDDEVFSESQMYTPARGLNHEG